MADKLDKMLDSYKVSDAGDPLLDRIVTAAQTQAANENAAKAIWFRRTAMLAATAVLGFWIGNATKPAVHATTATISSYSTAQTGSNEQYYLDRMIMGPDSLDDMQL
ncbi:MAG: hypothetical protein EPN97_14575 [Alphaproteobacteria bacterium]|nr:MAG: hypothetical protein EPN97_14575 [Alphaproteobacteria bacterium]